jgi:hypothetical protein
VGPHKNRGGAYEGGSYLCESTQPCLLINDLKLGDTRGAIALWGGSGTVGYFANLKIFKGE